MNLYLIFFFVQVFSDCRVFVRVISDPVGNESGWPIYNIMMPGTPTISTSSAYVDIFSYPIGYCPFRTDTKSLGVYTDSRTNWVVQQPPAQSVALKVINLAPPVVDTSKDYYFDIHVFQESRLWIDIDTVPPTGTVQFPFIWKNTGCFGVTFDTVIQVQDIPWPAYFHTGYLPPCNAYILAPVPAAGWQAQFVSCPYATGLTFGGLALPAGSNVTCKWIYTQTCPPIGSCPETLHGVTCSADCAAGSTGGRLCFSGLWQPNKCQKASFLEMGTNNKIRALRGSSN